MVVYVSVRLSNVHKVKFPLFVKILQEKHFAFVFIFLYITKTYIQKWQTNFGLNWYIIYRPLLQKKPFGPAVSKIFCSRHTVRHLNRQTSWLFDIMIVCKILVEMYLSPAMLLGKGQKGSSVFMTTLNFVFILTR